MILLKLLPVLDVTIWDEAVDQTAIQDIRDNGITLISEPTSLGLLSLTGRALLRRRRRSIPDFKTSKSSSRSSCGSIFFGGGTGRLHALKGISTAPRLSSLRWDRNTKPNNERHE